MTEKIKNRYNRIAGMYDVLDQPMEIFFSKFRKKMLAEITGNTLEVGIGTGRNIPFYPKEVKLTGIDFSEKMVEIAQKKAPGNTSVRILQMDAENMDFNDNTFDTVVTSCVFCSVPDPVKGLKEIRRVCKDGGKIVMLEHVRSEKTGLGELMDVFNFIPLHLYGANINRRTYNNLLKAGFKPNQIKVKNLWMDIVKQIKINNRKSNN